MVASSERHVSCKQIKGTEICKARYSKTMIFMHSDAFFRDW